MPIRLDARNLYNLPPVRRARSADGVDTRWHLADEDRIHVPPVHSRGAPQVPMMVRPARVPPPARRQSLSQIPRLSVRAENAAASPGPIFRAERLRAFCASFDIEDLPDDASLNHTQLALYCAQKDARRTAAHADLFVLPDEHIRAAFAQTCAKKAPRETAKNLSRFKISSQRCLTYIGCECMRFYPSCINLIKHLEIRNEENLLRVIVVAAANDPLGVANHAYSLKRDGILSDKSFWTVIEAYVKHGGPLELIFDKLDLSRQTTRMAALVVSYAKRVHYNISVLITKIGITDQSLLGDIAIAAANRDSTPPETFLADLGLTDAVILLKVAHTYARRGILAKCIDQFRIHNQDTLAELAEIDASHGKSDAQYFGKFRIQNERTRVNIARAYAKKGLDLAAHIEVFIIESENDRFDIACSLARGGVNIGNNIGNFCIHDASRRYEVAQLCVAHCADGLRDLAAFSLTIEQNRVLLQTALNRHSAKIAEFITSFDLEDEEKITTLLRCAKIDKNTIKYIKKFNIKDQKITHKAAMHYISNHVNAFSRSVSFRDFGITDPRTMEALGEKLIRSRAKAHIALCAFDYGDESIILRLADKVSTASNCHMKDIERVCVQMTEDGGYALAKKMASKGICGVASIIRALKICRSDRIEALARLAFLSDPDAPIHVKDFGIKEPALLAELAQMGANHLAEMAANISEFYLTDPEILFDVGKRCALAYPEKLAQHIQNFSSLTHDRRRDLAMLCAQGAPIAVAVHLPEFGLFHGTEADKVFARCLVNDSRCLRFAAGYGIHLAALGVIAVKTWDANDRPWPKRAFETAFDGIMEQFACCDCSRWMPNALQQVLTQHAREQLALRFACGLLALRLSFRPAEVQKLEPHGLLRACLDIPLREDSVRFAMHLGRACARREWLSHFMATPAQRGEHKQKSAVLVRAFLSGMKADGIRGVDALMARLNGQRFSRELRDVRRLHALLNVIIAINDADLPCHCKSLILDQITDFKQIKKLLLISTLKNQPEFIDLPKVSVDAIAARAIEREISSLGIDDCVERYFNTFGRSTDPGAIWRYRRSIEKTRDEHMRTAFNTMVINVLQGSFQTLRHDPRNNIHLAELESAAPGITAKFAKTCNVAVAPREEEGVWDAGMWLRQKLVDEAHLPGFEKLHYLHAYLIEDDLNASDRCRLQPHSVDSNLQVSCFDLIQTDCHQIDKRIKALASMRSGLRQLQLQGSQFANDVIVQHATLVKQNREANKDKNIRIVDTCDPMLLLLCGTQVSGSCLSVDGIPSMNKGLLGYVLNGQVRMLAALDMHGRILARSMLLLLSDGRGPVLYLERLYGDERFDGDLRAMARRKADALKIPVTVHPEEGNEAYGRPLKSLGGMAPWQYSDAAHGLYAQAAFVVNGVAHL